MRLPSSTLPLVAVLSLALGGCVHKAPTTPLGNHAPHITSVSVVPDTIALHDSITVTCHAVDQDGDHLVYDWFTQLPLKISGASHGEYLYQTSSNTRVLYFAVPDSNNPYVPVQVFARDTLGLEDGVQFRVYLRH